MSWSKLRFEGQDFCCLHWIFYRSGMPKNCNYLWHFSEIRVRRTPELLNWFLFARSAFRVFDSAGVLAFKMFYCRCLDWNLDKPGTPKVPLAMTNFCFQALFYPELHARLNPPRSQQISFLRCIGSKFFEFRSCIETLFAKNANIVLSFDSFRLPVHVFLKFGFDFFSRTYQLITSNIYRTNNSEKVSFWSFQQDIDNPK